MSFAQAGDFKVQIKQALVADSILNKKPQSWDICLLVENEDASQRDWYRMNFSADYTRIKGKENMTQAQVTMEKLKELGYQFDDLSQLDTLVGIVTIAHVEQKGTYFNVKYLGGGGTAPTAVDAATLTQMGAMLNGGAATAQPAASGFGTQPAAQQPATGGFSQQPATGGFGQ